MSQYPPPKRPGVRRRNGEYLVRFGYWPDLNRALRNLEGIWDPGEKVWRIDEAYADELDEILSEYGVRLVDAETPPPPRSGQEKGDADYRKLAHHYEILKREHESLKRQYEAERNRRVAAETARDRAERAAKPTGFKGAPWHTVFRDLPPNLRQPVYRALAKTVHPDAGGDDFTMRRINAAYDDAKR